MFVKNLYNNLKKFALIGALAFGLINNDLEVLSSENEYGTESFSDGEDILNNLTIADSSNNDQEHLDKINDRLQELMLRYDNILNEQNKEENITETLVEDQVENLKAVEVISNDATNDLKVITESLVNENLMSEDDISLEILRAENQELIDAITERYNITPEQFNIIACVIMREALPYNNSNYNEVYVDAYAAINAFYNRLYSIKWRGYVNYWSYDGAGENLFGQITAPGQSQVYEEETYTNILNVDKTGHPAYQAVIALLSTEEVMHNYTSFKASSSKADGKEQFVPGGNRYHSELLPEDRYVEDKGLSLELIAQ